MQPRVAAGVRSMHQEHAVRVAHDDVRDELLVGRIVLGRRSIEVPAPGRDRRAQRFEVAGIGLANAVKVTAAGDVGPRQDEDALRHRQEPIRALVRLVARSR